MPETALQFEKVLGVGADIWMGLETTFRIHLAREAEARKAADAKEWIRAFPGKELVKRGIFESPGSDAAAMSSLLAFFRVGSIEAWADRYGPGKVAYRHSPRFRSDEYALATLLRLGELEAGEQVCAEYNRSRFIRTLREIRGLTREPFVEAMRQAVKLCNEAGVAFVLTRPLPGTAISGAAWWPSPCKAVIMLTARHRTDDHLWFSFFHEAAHILLHGKKDVFVDESIRDVADREKEANDWASGMLINKSAWQGFVATSPRSERSVREFAEEQGVSPGIVVCMLQYNGILPWSHLNGLKVKLDLTA